MFQRYIIVYAYSQTVTCISAHGEKKIDNRFVRTYLFREYGLVSKDYVWISKYFPSNDDGSDLQTSKELNTFI